MSDRNDAAFRSEFQPTGPEALEPKPSEVSRAGNRDILKTRGPMRRSR